MKCRTTSWLFLLAVLCAWGHPLYSRAQEDALRDLYRAGSQLLKEVEPENLLDDLEPPSPKEWSEFWKRLEGALQSGSLDDLSWLMPYAKTAAEFLRATAEGRPYADWLEQRLDYFDMARSVLRAVPSAGFEVTPPIEPAPGKFRLAPPSRPGSTPSPPAITARRMAIARSPDAWKRKLTSRPMPPNANTLVPALKNAFRSEGVPTPWVWLAEVESTMNPSAKSPVGAVGLFQFMAPTARRFGLKSRPLDERLLPEKSARAAAKYLKVLHQQFNSWPLTLAAYNAGEGRVGRLLENSSAKTFEAIEESLPLETQMYVPKVVAIVALREGVDPAKLPAPTAMKMPEGIFPVAWVFRTE